MRLASIVLAAAALAACGGHPKTIPKEADQPPPPTKSLYERLGGTPGITAVVEEFVTTTGKDPRIAQFFSNADIPRLKKLMVEQICQNTGGPCHYTGKTMKESHATMHVKGGDFEAFIDDLAKTLAKLNVPAPETKEVLTAFQSLKTEVVTE
jgi:hemoglobin